MKHLDLIFNLRNTMRLSLFVTLLSFVLTSEAQITSTGSGGNWSATTTWVGGVVPTAVDDVTIADGALVTVDNTTAVCANLTVGQGTSGKVTYVAGTTAATLTVNGDLTVATGGVFDAGTGTGSNSKKLNLGGNTSVGALAGNLTVNGTFDMGTTGEAATSSPTGVITFFGANNATVSGNAVVLRFNAIVVNKGINSSSEVNVNTVISQRTPGSTGGTPRLTITSGTFKLSSASTITPYFAGETICAVAGRLWLNNAGASVSSAGGGSGAVTVTGELKIDAGKFNYGTGADALTVNGTLSISGGELNINGRVVFGNASTFIMTGGQFNLDPQNTANLGGTAHIVQFGTSGIGTTNVTFTGGTMTLINPHATSSTSGIALTVLATAGTYNFAGSTIVFGDGVSTKAGSADGFEVNTSSAALGNIIVNNTSSNPANRFVKLVGNSTIAGTLTINAQSEFRLAGFTLNLKSAFVNNGTFTGNEANSHLILSGTSAQPFNVGTYTGSSLTQLTINNPGGVTLGAALNVGTLNLTLGKLTTTSSNLISVTGTSVANVTGGSTGSFVEGPISRALPNALASGTTYAFPVGKGTYQLFELVNPTTSATGSVTVEVFDANSNGTAGFGLSSLNTNRYWTATPSGSFIKTTSVRLTEGALSGANRVGQSATVSGTYVSRGGGTVSPVLSGNVSVTLGSFVLGSANPNLPGGTYTVGSTGQLIKLTDVANVLNTSTLTGDATFEMQPDYDGTFGETFPIAFKQFATSGGNWSATIRPASGATALTTSGDQVTSGATIGLISFDTNATRITIDGRAGGTGSTIGWTFRNTRTASAVGPTIRFINGANNISLNYLRIEGQNTTTSSGTIAFLTSGGLTGNSFNSITNCEIGNRSDGLGTNNPAIGIYSAGTAGKLNSDNTISNNKIFNFTSSGIYVNGNTNGNNWTIDRNSFYCTLNATTAQAAINIQPGTGAGNYTITNNYIGGKDTMASGGNWTNAGNVAFYGVYLNVTGQATSTVQGNVIQNILMSGVGSSSFTGIHIENGKINLGDQIGNIIGSATAANSIQVFGTGATRGIFSSPGSATDAVVIANNTIANISALGTGAGVVLNGIYADGGINTISDNLIFNLSSGSSNASATNGASVAGVVNVANGATQTVTHNHIHSLTNTFLVSGVSVIGIYFGTTTTTQTFNVSRNYVHNFSITSQVLSSQQIGIYGASNSRSRVTNNMVSLGRNADGASETLAQTLIGFNKIGTASYNIYHNSLYVGGSGVDADTTRTYAFRKGSTGADTVWNNIFVNERSNATTGGKHYAIYLGNKTNLQLNNNVYYVNGTGTVFGFDAVTNRADLAEWKTANATFDNTSLDVNPNFVMPDGDATTTDLHIRTDIPSQLESGALPIAIVTDDLDAEAVRGPYPLAGQINGGGSGPDIGADENDIIPFDFSAPEIGYTALANSCSVTDRTISATISKSTGLPSATAGALVPRIYYKKGSGNYFSSPGVLTTGNGFFGTWTFTISNVDMGGVVSGDSVFYFIIAQDSSETPDISSEPAGVVASSVNTIVTPPTPNVFIVGAMATPTITQSNDTLTSSPAVTYQWYLDNNPINGATSQTIVAQQSGDYSVKISDGSGCESTSGQYTVIITSTTSVEGNASISIAPNPALTDFVLTAPFSSVGNEYEVLTIGGNLISKGRIENPRTQVSVSHLPTGIYLIKALGITQKLVKQ